MSSKKLRALEKVWYDRLRLGGFRDIECTRLPDKPLLQYESCYFIARYDALTFENQRTYFEMTAQFLSIFQFPNTLHKKIWALHSDGYSLREIAREINSIQKDTINKIITSYRIQMHEVLKDDESDSE